jgi:hypothetical protein
MSSGLTLGTSSRRLFEGTMIDATGELQVSESPESDLACPLYIILELGTIS